MTCSDGSVLTDLLCTCCASNHQRSDVLNDRRTFAPTKLAIDTYLLRSSSVLLLDLSRSGCVHRSSSPIIERAQSTTRCSCCLVSQHEDEDYERCLSIAGGSLNHRLERGVGGGCHNGGDL